jgi:Na+-translocating ferredoxin:NAD+ oxidoreductase subunit G
MKKLESSFLNMLLVLMGIAVVAAGALGTVFDATKTPIENAKSAKQSAAIEQVVPGFNNNPTQEVLEFDIDGEKVRVFPAKKDGVTIGAAVETFTKNGFSGVIKIMVGFDSTGKIINYSVLEHKETPGLGSKMQEWFRTGKGNITGFNPAENKLNVSKDGGEVDAITAATISSRAFLDAIDRGYKVYMREFDTITGATQKY